MAKWQKSLKIATDWALAQSKEITTAELAKRIAVKLSALRPVEGDEDLEEERLELAANFKSMGEDETLTVDEFDDAMSALYDWADTPLDDVFGGKKLCWVATF